MVVRLHGTVMPTGDESCPWCGRGFWTIRDLNDHIRNDHHFGPANQQPSIDTIN